MKFLKTALLAAAFATGAACAGAEEDCLAWTSTKIQCERSAEAGDVSCEAKCDGKKFKKLQIEAFGKSFALNESELERLEGFPLSSLQTFITKSLTNGESVVDVRLSRTRWNDDEKRVEVSKADLLVTKDGKLSVTIKLIDKPAF